MLPLPPPPPQAPIADATEETPYVKPRPPRKWFPLGKTRKGGTLSEDDKWSSSNPISKPLPETLDRCSPLPGLGRAGCMHAIACAETCWC